jgi:mono/diheme cytochrome c family protein
MKTLTLTLLPLALLAACGDAPAGDVDNGKALYDANCAGCHGADGNGVGGNPSIVGESGAEVSETIRNGKGSMPAFGSTLSDAEIADVRAYVETL